MEWGEPGRICLEGFFLIHTQQRRMCLLHEETENFGFFTVCKKETKTNFIKTELFSLSDCKSVYKCNACGCVSSCVIGKAETASFTLLRSFPAWAPKAHGRSLFVPFSDNSFKENLAFYSPSEKIHLHSVSLELVREWKLFVQIIHSET